MLFRSGCGRIKRLRGDRIRHLGSVQEHQKDFLACKVHLHSTSGEMCWFGELQDRVRRLAVCFFQKTDALPTPLVFG